MSKIIITELFLVLLIFSTALAVSATEADFYATKVSPTQVAPGEVSTLRITLKNLGTSFASRIEASLDPADTSPIDPVGAGRVQIGEAKKAQTTAYFSVVKQSEEITLEFNFSVDPEASEKTYSVPLVLNWDAGESTKKTQTLQLGIRVKKRNADFQVLKVVPETLPAGETRVLTIILKNSGGNYAYDLKADLDAGDASPIDPIGPTRVEFESQKILPGREVELQYPVNVKQNTLEKVYYVPLDLEWEDDTSTTKTQNIKVGLLVKDPHPVIEVSYEAPDMVSAGDGFDISLTLLNKGAGSLKDIDITVNSSANLAVSPEPPNNLHLNSLSVEGKERVLFSFKADERSEEGLYLIPVTVSYESYGGTEKLQYEIIPLTIKKDEPAIQVGQDLPAYIKPGDTFNATLMLRNTGGTAKNIDVIIDSQGASILPKGPNNIHLEELSSGETYNIEMNFISSKDLTTGLYNIPVTLKYEGLDGQLKSQRERVPIEVKGLAKLNIANLKIEPQNPRKGDEITIELRIENVGDASAENTKLLLDSDLEGFKTAYIGELKKDDDTPAIFTLKSAAAGETVNTLTLSYEDDFGEHGLSEEIRFDVSNGQTQNLGNVLVILLIAAVFVGFYKLKKSKG
ncbi:hypothetical protein BMS3Abin16_01280 [archaeon BMS3Abin16]|nr:hypothetical protein BMS3Abin16_01280 [archaeon BMS3Abin16]